MPILEELNNIYDGVTEYTLDSIYGLARIIYSPIYQLGLYFSGRPY
jgi:hypothetical protein